VTTDGAGRMRALLPRGEAPPAAFRAALTAVAPADRDAWLDRVLGLDAIPDDGPSLPSGCVPYLPCPVDALLRAVDLAAVEASDVFVDVGAGVGRAAALVHLLTGAAAVGVEVQPALVAAARALSARLRLPRVSVIEADASRLADLAATGSVFFLYCPFSGPRLEALLDDLGAVARARPIRVCCVDLPLPPRPWLALVSPPTGDLAVYRSVAPG
jgi:SAM-dependent methyltransferase